MNDAQKLEWEKKQPAEKQNSRTKCSSVVKLLDFFDLADTISSITGTISLKTFISSLLVA